MAKDLKQSFRDVSLDIEFEKILLHAKQIERDAYAPNLKIEDEKNVVILEELKIPSYQELIEKLNKIKEKEIKEKNIAQREMLKKTSLLPTELKNQTEDKKEKIGEIQNMDQSITDEGIEERVEDNKDLNSDRMLKEEIHQRQKKRLEEILKRLRSVEKEKVEDNQIKPHTLAPNLDQELRVDNKVNQKDHEKQKNEVNENKEEELIDKTAVDNPPLDIFKKLEQNLNLLSQKIPPPTKESGEKVQISKKEKEQKQTKRKTTKRNKKETSAQKIKIEKEKEDENIESQDQIPIIKPKKITQETKNILLGAKKEEGSISALQNLEKAKNEKVEEEKKEIEPSLIFKREEKNKKFEAKNTDSSNRENKDKTEDIEEEPILINKNLAKKLGIEKKLNITEKLKTKNLRAAENIYIQTDEEREGEEVEENLKNYSDKDKLDLSEQAEKLLEGEEKEDEGKRDPSPQVYIAYARENIPWLYDIYKIGGISFDEFKRKVKEKMNKGQTLQEEKNLDENNLDEYKKESEIKIKKFKK